MDIFTLENPPGFQVSETIGLVRGNTILGGVDPNTGLTYGFDPNTGAPDPGRNMNEPEIFSGLLQALGIDTSEASLPNVPAMRNA